jgi:hypothetical protein
MAAKTGVFVAGSFGRRAAAPLPGAPEPSGRRHTKRAIRPAPRSGVGWRHNKRRAIRPAPRSGVGWRHNKRRAIRPAPRSGVGWRHNKRRGGEASFDSLLGCGQRRPVPRDGGGPPLRTVDTAILARILLMALRVPTSTRARTRVERSLTPRGFWEAGRRPQSELMPLAVRRGPRPPISHPARS